MRSCHPRSVSFPPRRTANGTFQAQSEASKSCWPTKMSASDKDGNCMEDVQWDKRASSQGQEQCL